MVASLVHGRIAKMCPPVTAAGTEDVECRVLAFTASAHISLAKTSPSPHLASCTGGHVIFLSFQKGARSENTVVMCVIITMSLSTDVPIRYD